MEDNSHENAFNEDSDDSVKDRDYFPVDTNNDKTDESYSSDCSGTVEEQRNYSELQSTTSNFDVILKKKTTRKRQRNPDSWASNKRKKQYDQGLEYVSSRKKVVPAKKIRNIKDCLNACIWKCSGKITNEEREELFKDYYKLNTSEKRMFILSTTEKFMPTRRRKGKTDINSKRTATFRYFFDLRNTRTQVCKKFYCGTLCISQKPIYTVHKTNNPVTNILGSSTQGKHSKNSHSNEDVDLVKEHIDLFPRIESHYRRTESRREYLDSSLSIRKMYELYKEWVQAKDKQPLKESAYRYIFCNNYNLHFHVPKKDRCDLCEEIRILEKEKRITQDRKTVYDDHIKEKIVMREERNRDRKMNTPVLCFDLENVLSCPKAEISSFFYKSKFSVYNLTAHLSSTKKVYCALWPETLSGRSGNDIASALVKILEAVFRDNPEITELILWSDSCVPQNRNSHISFAMADFMKRHGNLKSLTMKYSTPGHSCVQEIDLVHSCIERVLSKAEYFSPVSLLRLPLQVNRNKPYKVIQMHAEDFKNFQECATLFDYTKVPYTKIQQINFSGSIFNINYKTSHAQEDFVTHNIKRIMGKRQTAVKTHISFPVAKQAKPSHILPQNKIDSIISMYRWMPTIDKEYFKTIFPSQTSDTGKKGKKERKTT